MASDWDPFINFKRDEVGVKTMSMAHRQTVNAEVDELHPERQMRRDWLSVIIMFGPSHIKSKYCMPLVIHVNIQATKNSPPRMPLNQLKI